METLTSGVVRVLVVSLLARSQIRDRDQRVALGSPFQSARPPLQACFPPGHERRDTPSPRYPGRSRARKRARQLAVRAQGGTLVEALFQVVDDRRERDSCELLLR